MIRPAITFLCLALLAWGGSRLITNLGLFPTLPQLHSVMHWTAVVLFACAAVFAAGFAIFEVTMAGLLQQRPSKLTRSVTLILLSIAAAIVVLSQAGVAVGGLLTTSAVLGGILGLSLQPTLGNIVAGLALSSDRILKVGSVLHVDGQLMEVEELHWRHVIARRRDEMRVILPNAYLSGQPLQVYSEDRSTRFDTFIDLPADIPPERVSDALVGAFTDMEHIDTDRPFMVAPVETRPRDGALRYRIRCFARNHLQIAELKGEVLRRAWYVLERAGLHMPRNRLYSAHALLESKPETVEEAGRVYRFGPNEPLVVASGGDPTELMILRGQARQEQVPLLAPVEFGQSARPYLSPLPVDEVHRSVHLRQMTEALAQALGPGAEHVVEKALQTCADFEKLSGRLALAIEDEALRAAFLEALPEFNGPLSMGPGARLPLVKDINGQFATRPALRAMGEVTVLVIGSDGAD